VHADAGLAELMFLDAAEAVAVLWKALEDNHRTETYLSADGMDGDLNIGGSARAVAYAAH